jgi:hypothetical protein
MNPEEYQERLLAYVSVRLGTFSEELDRLGRRLDQFEAYISARLDRLERDQAAARAAAAAAPPDRTPA